MPPRYEQLPKKGEWDDEDFSSGKKGAQYDKRSVREAKRSGEILPIAPLAPVESQPIAPTSEAAETPDASAHFEAGKRSYIELGKKIQAMGVEPKEIPHIWGFADVALDEIKKSSKEYESETDPLKKEKIAARMERLGADLATGRVSDQILDAAREVRNEKRESQPLESPAHKEFNELWDETLRQIPKVAKQQEASVEIEPEVEAAVVEEVAAPEPEEEEVALPEKVSLDALTQIYGTETPPADVVALYERLKNEKDRAEYLEYVRARHGAEKPAAIPAEAVVLEAAEQQLVDENIEAAHPAAAPEIPTLTDVVTEEEFAKMRAEAKIPTLTDVVSPEEFEALRKAAAPAPEIGSIVPNPEDAIEKSRLRELLNAEGTPKEWKDKLRETVAWWASPSERLARRSKELDAEAKNIGGVEKLFTALGKKYDKMPLKYKLAVGASLGLGAVFTAGTLAAALPLLGIGAQRIAGFATMYQKFEKNSKEGKWGKEKAMLKAGAYTVFMGLAMKEAIELASETEVAHGVQAKVNEWLGNMLGHHTTPEAPVEAAAPAEQVAQPAAAAAAGEVAVTVPEVEMPSIEASKGHGYEFMMKQLWEDLNAKGVKLPSGANPDSDLAKLLSVKPGDEAGINELVHKLASDPKHGFYNPDGTSARINMGSHLTIDSSGNLKLDGEMRAPSSSGVIEGQNPNIDDETRRRALESVAPLSPEATVADVVPQETVVPETPTPVQPENLVQAHGENVLDSSGQPVMTGSAETLVVNKFGVEVPSAVSHVYATADSSQVFAYGGTMEERMKMITDYIARNPGATVFSADESGKYRVPWTLTEGKVVAGKPVETGGIFGLMKTFVSAPGPDEFEKIIK